MLKRGATARRSAVSLRQQHGVDPVDVVLHGRLNELSSMPTQIVKIYVCSTVADFEFERRSLWQTVLPELQLRFIPHGIDVQLVDMQHGCRIDHVYDRRTFDRHLSEIEACHGSSHGPFFLCLIGDKRGLVLLPSFIEAEEFIHIRNAIFESGKDVKLTNEWYVKDDNAVPPVYSLQPVTKKFKHFSCRDAATSPETDHDVERWLDTFHRLQGMLQAGATSCFRDGKINQEHEYKQQKYFMSGVEQEIQQALEISTTDCLFAMRRFKDINSTHDAATRFTDMTADRKPDTYAHARMQTLRDILSTKLAGDNCCHFNVAWHHKGLAPQDCAEHADYVDDFCSTLVERLTSLIERRIENKILVGIYSTEKRHVFSEALPHCMRCLHLSCQVCPELSQTEERIRGLLQNGACREHQAILVYAPEGSGKSVLLSRACHMALELFGKDTMVIMRYVGLTSRLKSRSQSLRDLLSSICTQLDFLLNHNMDLMKDDVERLLSYYYALLNRVSKSGRHLLLMLDGIDQLKSTLQSDDVKINWLAGKLMPKVHIVLSFNTTQSNADVSRIFISKFVYSDYLVPVSRLTETEIEKTLCYELSRQGRRVTDSQLKEIRTAVKNAATPMLVRLIQEEADRWPSHFSPTSLPETVDGAIALRLDGLERKYGALMIGQIARYISSASSGLSESELLDVLSCNTEALQLAGQTDRAAPVLRFPFSLWQEIRQDLGMFLEERFIDCKTLLCWSHQSVWHVIVQRYFTRVDKIKQSHKDIADLFLDAWAVSKQMSPKLASGWRCISQQPLLYSETKYNLRRLSELWYQLLHAGNIDSLKDNCFCNYDYLLASMHARSVTCLISALEKGFCHVLDAEIHVILRCVVQAKRILLRDPLQLASELIGRLRQVKEYYPNHIDSLVQQCMEWCDSHNLPLIVPLSSWLPDPRTSLVTTVDCPDGVQRLCVTPNGQHMFCTTPKNEVYMYHVPSKKLIRTFAGHRAPLTGVALTRSNKFVLSASMDRSLRMSEINSGKAVRVFKDHGDAILCMLITTADDYVITGCKDCYFRVISLDTGQVIHSKKEHAGPVTCLSLNAKNTILLTASNDRSVKTWTFDDLELLNVIDDNITSGIVSMALSVDNTFLILGLDDQSLIVKSFTTGSDVHQLKGHKGKVTDVLVSRDCFHCVAACTDGCVYTYNLRTTEVLDVFSSSRSGPASVCLSRDEYFIFSAAKDTVKVWTFYKRHTRGIHTDDHTDHVTCIAISRDGKTAITGSKDKVVKLWNLDISDFLENLTGHEAAVTCVAMGDNEEFAASGSDDCTVKVWSVIMGCVITNYTEHESSINNILVVHERHLVLSSETNGVIKLWQAEDGETCMTLFGPVQWLCIAPNSQFAVSGSGAQSLKLWRVDTGDICQSVNHADRITCVTFSGDSQYLVTGSADKSLKVWEAATGKLTQVLVEHTACVSCVAVSDSNRHVISGSHDTNLLVWGLSTGAVEHQLTGHTDHVTCVKITSDGTTALSGSRDGCLHIWNMTYGLPVTIFDMHLAVLNVEMTPDAAHIVVQLERSRHVPLMCLHNSPAGEVKSQSQIEIQVLGGGPVLPIKAKPLTASHPTARFMTSKLQKFTDLYPSVSSIPEIVKTPLQKAVKAQEQNKETRGQRSMFGSLRPRNSSKKTQHASKSGICTLL